MFTLIVVWFMKIVRMILHQSSQRHTTTLTCLSPCVSLFGLTEQQMQEFVAVRPDGPVRWDCTHFDRCGCLHPR